MHLKGRDVVRKIKAGDYSRNINSVNSDLTVMKDLKIDKTVLGIPNNPLCHTMSNYSLVSYSSCA